MASNSDRRVFRNIASRLPEWMVRGYEIEQLMKDYDKEMKELAAEVGAHRAVELDNELCKAAGRKVFEEVLEEMRTTGMIKIREANGTVHYERVDS